MKDRERSEFAGYSKANIVIGKVKRKHDDMKNHLGPRRNISSLRTLEDQKEVVMCVAN